MWCTAPPQCACYWNPICDTFISHVWQLPFNPSQFLQAPPSVSFQSFVQPVLRHLIQKVWKSPSQTKLKYRYVIIFTRTWKFAEIFGTNNLDYTTGQHIRNPPPCTQPLSSTLLAKWNISSYIYVIFCFLTLWFVFLSQDPGAMLSRSDVRVPPTWQSLLLHDMSFSNVCCNNDRFSANGKFFLKQRGKKKSPKKPVQMDLGHRKTHENENNLIAVK